MNYIYQVNTIINNHLQSKLSTLVSLPGDPVASVCDEDYGEVADLREPGTRPLPNIVLDHGHVRRVRRDTRHVPDILVCDARAASSGQLQVPVIVISGDQGDTSDGEMEDYYDNHKDWPPPPATAR